MYNTATTIAPNPRAVDFIRRRGRVTEPHARALAELAGYRQSLSNTEIIDRALARLAQVKRGACG
jgi:hypothetical protein